MKALIWMGNTMVNSIPNTENEIYIQPQGTWTIIENSYVVLFQIQKMKYTFNLKNKNNLGNSMDENKFKKIKTTSKFSATQYLEWSLCYVFTIALILWHDEGFASCFHQEAEAYAYVC